MSLKKRIGKLERVCGAETYQTPVLEMYESLYIAGMLKQGHIADAPFPIQTVAMLEELVMEIIETGVLPDAFSTFDDWRWLAREWKLPCVMGKA